MGHPVLSCHTFTQQQWMARGLGYGRLNNNATAMDGLSATQRQQGNAMAMDGSTAMAMNSLATRGREKFILIYCTPTQINWNFK
jgi:hypothetical protein